MNKTLYINYASIKKKKKKYSNGNGSVIHWQILGRLGLKTSLFIKVCFG